MNKNRAVKYLKIVIIIISFINPSCEFEPKGKYEVDIKQITNPPEIRVKFNIDFDTVYVPFSDNVVILEFSTNDPYVLDASFELNNNSIGKTAFSNGFFYLDFKPDQYEVGVPYVLKVTIFRRSGSGSLADKYLQEGFFYSKEFILIFEGETHIAPKIIKVIPEDGSLKIIWEKFSGVGFKSYHVFNGDYEIAVISDVEQTSIFDPSFIGFGLFYVVVETNSDQYMGQATTFNDINFSTTGSKLSDKSLFLSWNKTKYEKNLAGYRLYRAIKETGEITEIAFITDPVDTTFIVDLDMFPGNMRFYIKAVSKVPEQQYYLNSDNGSSLYFRMGDKIPYIYENVLDKSIGSTCYFISSMNTYRFDSNNQSITDSIQFTNPFLSLSKDGTRLLIGRNGRLEIISTTNMALIDFVPLPFLPEETMPMQFYISDSDIGVIVNSSNKYFYFDFHTKAKLAEFTTTNSTSSGDRMRISSNGSFFCARHWTLSGYITELFKLEGSLAAQIWTAPVSFTDFDPINNYFIYFSNGKLYTTSLPDLIIVKELNISDEFIYDIDWNRQEFVSHNSEQNLLSICDLETGVVKAQVKTTGIGGFWHFNQVFLLNKTLFINDLKLQLDYQ